VSSDGGEDLPRSGRVLFLGLALAILAASRAPSLDVLIWNMDEGATGAIAEVILDGGIPYRDGVDHRGPVTYYVYALVFWLAGEDGATRLYALHVALIAWLGVVAWRCQRLGSAISGDRTGAFAAVALAALATCFRPTDGFAFHTEWVLVLLSLEGMICTLAFLRGGSAAYGISAGAAFGLAFLTKQTAALDLASAVAVATGHALLAGREPGIRPALRSALAMGGGFLVPVGATLACFAAHGAAHDLARWFWWYNTEIYVPAVPLSERLAAALRFWDAQPFQIPLFALLAPAGVAVVWRTRLRAGPAATEFWTGLLPVAWIAGAWVGASLSGRGFGHYYLQLLPPASVLAALALQRLRAAALRRAGGSGRTPARLGDAGVLAAIALAAAPVLRLPEPDAGGWPLVDHAARGANAPIEELVSLVQASTSEDDRIFVWGWYASLYTLTERLPATRFVYCTFLAGLIPWTNLEAEDTRGSVVPGAFEELEADLRRSPPALVVDTSPGDHAHFGRFPIRDVPPLARLLEGYDRVHVARLPGGEEYFHVYRRRAHSP
jgi:hypothetical protein